MGAWDGFVLCTYLWGGAQKRGDHTLSDTKPPQLFVRVFLNENRESTFMPLPAQAGTKSLIGTEGGKNIYSPAPTSHVRRSQ